MSSKELRLEALNSQHNFHQLLPSSMLIGENIDNTPLERIDSNEDIIQHCLKRYYQKSLSYTNQA
jgi:hypothetical protein